jgi:diaminopimelate decarboxylase
VQWTGELAPGHDRRQGELTVGGVGVLTLAQTYGTPLLALDYGVLDAEIEAFTRACAPHDVEIAYACKALLVEALAQHLKHTALHLDLSSLGELCTAERAAFPPERLTLHGCAKTDEELDAVTSGRAGRIVVDNLEELRRLGARSDAGASINVLFRINTGIEAHTHRFVRTSGAESKFGFDPEAFVHALQELRAHPRLRFVGLHSHIGSQIYQAQAFAANAQALMATAAVCERARFPVRTVIVGGGFGVQMRPEVPDTIDAGETIETIVRTVASCADEAGLPRPRIGIEPGRALIADAGTSIYTVAAVKTSYGRRYAIVDGGVYENPRPALYGAYHHIVCASRASTEPVETVVCGRTCENDELGVAGLPADLRAGDLLAACTTGAYTYSMASNYNRFTRPAVAAVRAGAHRLIARRESVDDVIRNDLDA